MVLVDLWLDTAQQICCSGWNFMFLMVISTNMMVIWNTSLDIILVCALKRHGDSVGNILSLKGRNWVGSPGNSPSHAQPLSHAGSPEIWNLQTIQASDIWVTLTWGPRHYGSDINHPCSALSKFLTLEWHGSQLLQLYSTKCGELCYAASVVSKERWKRTAVMQELNKEMVEKWRQGATGLMLTV